MHAATTGGDADTPIVALHSSGAGARQWASWQPWLPVGVRWIAPDLIGYGSDSAWRDGDAVSLDDEARRVAATIDALARPVHLVGHSYGGAVALRVALHWPHLVQRLSLFEPVLFALLRDADADAWRLITGVGHEIGALARAGQAMASAALFVDYWSGDGAWDALGAKRQQAVASRMAKVSTEFDALFADEVGAVAYRRLRMPVRLAGGERSPLPARRVVAALARTLPAVQTLLLPGLGHMGPVESPGRVADAFGLVTPATVTLLAA